MVDGGWVVAGGAVMAALGAGLLAANVRRIRRGLSSTDWPTVPGRVTNSRVERGEFLSFHVKYTYEVDGLSHEGDTLQVGHSVNTRREAEALLESYAIGTEVEVHYDPADPSRSVLLPSVASGAAWGIVAAVMFLCFGIWFVTIGVGRLGASPTPEAEAPRSFLNSPAGIAVAADGTVYVCDQGPEGSQTASAPDLSAIPDFPTTTATPDPLRPTVPQAGTGRLLRLSPDLTDSTTLVSQILESPSGLAVDSSGTFYVADQVRLWVFTPEERSGHGETKLNGSTRLPGPFTKGGVAVDSAGTAYVTDQFSGLVLRLPAGDTTATVLFKAPENGWATDVAVDNAGNVYVTDANNHRVFKIPSGGDPTELPFPQISRPQGIAVDNAGTVYVVDSGHHRVMKLVAGTPAATVAPFEGLKFPYDVAVDTAGNVYVTDQENRQVMKFPPHQ